MRARGNSHLSKNKRSTAKGGNLERGMKQSILLRNLEEWIEEIIARDGLADKELVKNINQRFELAMQANIEYHKFMAKNVGDDLTVRHNLMAEVYKALSQRPAKNRSLLNATD